VSTGQKGSCTAAWSSHDRLTLTATYTCRVQASAKAFSKRIGIWTMCVMHCISIAIPSAGRTSTLSVSASVSRYRCCGLTSRRVQVLIVRGDHNRNSMMRALVVLRGSAGQRGACHLPLRHAATPV